MDDYSARIWHLWDESRLIELDIDKAMLGDITSLTPAQNWITRASSDAIMLGDILSYLRDSINEFVADLTLQEPKRSPDDPLIQELKRIQNDSKITTKRVNDTQKVIRGLESKMVALRDFSNALAEKHMRRISNSMAQNTKSMMQMTESNNRASDALSIIELILAGSVILEVVLVIVGEYGFPNWLGPLFDTGFGTLIVLLTSVVLWVAVFIFLRVSKRRLEISAVKRQTGTYVIGKRCNIENLNKFLASKNIILRNTESEGESELISISWDPVENKKKDIPDIESVILLYDAKEAFIIQLELETPDVIIDLQVCFDYIINQMTEYNVFTIDAEENIC